MSTERRLSRSFHSCLKGSSTEEAADEEESCYHSLGGRHTLNRHPQVYVEDLSNVTLADFENSQDDIDVLPCNAKTPELFRSKPTKAEPFKHGGSTACQQS